MRTETRNAAKIALGVRTEREKSSLTFHNVKASVGSRTLLGMKSEDGTHELRS